MRVKINRRQKYEVNFGYSSDCPEWKWKVQRVFDLTWNKFISWNPLLGDVIILDDSDTWSADFTLSKLAVPLLEKLQKEKHGYGYIADEDVPEELRTGNKEHSEEKYDWFMQEIIWCLNEIAEEEPNAPDIELDEDIWLFNSEERTPEHQKHTDEWLQAMTKYEDRVSNGCRLFGLYFRTLWD